MMLVRGGTCAFEARPLAPIADKGKGRGGVLEFGRVCTAIPWTQPFGQSRVF